MRFVAYDTMALVSPGDLMLPRDDGYYLIERQTVELYENFCEVSGLTIDYYEDLITRKNKSWMMESDDRIKINSSGQFKIHNGHFFSITKIDRVTPIGTFQKNLERGGK